MAGGASRRPSLGLPSNCTMLYGHVETMADRVDHLLALRALQDETALPHYIPLAYHPDHNELGEALAGPEPRRRASTT